MLHVVENFAKRRNAFFARCLGSEHLMVQHRLAVERPVQNKNPFHLEAPHALALTAALRDVGVEQIASEPLGDDGLRRLRTFYVVRP
jgi:hypothetical protein